MGDESSETLHSMSEDGSNCDDTHPNRTKECYDYGAAVLKWNLRNVVNGNHAK